MSLRAFLLTCSAGSSGIVGYLLLGIAFFEWFPSFALSKYPFSCGCFSLIWFAISIFITAQIPRGPRRGGHPPG